MYKIIFDESQQLKDAGLKVTAPRVKILQILEQANPHHCSAEDIYKKLIELGEDVGLATVYRVLAQFEAAGIIQKHYFTGGVSVFELNSEDHHDHLVCIKCHKVVEFVDDFIEKRQEDIAQEAKFKITSHALNIYGICDSCI